jgi:hypothetical protein
MTAILLRVFLLSMSIISRWSKFLFFCVPIFIAIHQLACAAPVPPEKVADGVVFHVGDRLLKLDVCSDDIIRVAYVNDTAFFARKTLAAGVRQDARTQWSLKTDNGEAILATDRLPRLKVTKIGDKLKRAYLRFSLPNGPGRCGSSGFTCAAFH